MNKSILNAELKSNKDKDSFCEIDAADNIGHENGCCRQA
jgi:hypothetical protein